MFLISPIVAKDLRPLLRSRQAYWLTLAMLVGVGVILILVAKNASDSATISTRSFIGRIVFIFVSCAQICCFGLFAPALTATSISSEREMRTFDLLESTALSRLNILWSKWWAAIAFLLVAGVLLLPFQMMVFQFGGVGRDEYFTVAAIMLTVVFTYSMMGLAVSSMFRRSATALAVTILLVVLQNIVAPMALVMLADWNVIAMREQDAFNASANFSALIAFIMTFESSFLRRVGGNAFGMVLPMLAVHWALFLLYAWIAWRKLRRVESVRAPVARKLIHDPAVIERRRRQFPYYVIDPQARAHHIPDGRDPVLVREQRTGALSRPTVLIRICYGALLLSVVYGLERIINDPQDAPRDFALLLMILGTLFIPTLAALTISKEREAGTLELLMASPIRPMQIVIAKFRATLRFMIFISASFLAFPFFVYLAHMGTSIPAKLGYVATAIVLIAPCLAAFFSLFAAAGILMSCISRKTSVSLVSTYLLIFIMSLLPQLVMFIHFLVYRVFTDRHEWGDDFVVRWFVRLVGRSFSPIECLGHTAWNAFRGGSVFSSAGLGFLVNAAVTLAISWGMLWLAAAILERRART